MVVMKTLLAGAAALGVTLSTQQVEQFARYRAELLDWNTRFNLTAIRDPREVEIRLFLDALTCLQVLPPGALRLIDVGSGAGFPGLALKLARPELQVTLLEATGKKAQFLQHVVAALALDGVTVLNTRAEQAGQDPAQRERYDWAVARAVAELRVLAEYLLPLVRVGGRALAQKGAGIDEELAAAGPALAALGGRLTEVRMVRVPGLDGERHLVVVDKLTPAPAQYPRRAGVPAKKPL
jgi:16S rRNA (guanine527-N7)-methyltransferase